MGHPVSSNPRDCGLSAMFGWFAFGHFLRGRAGLSAALGATALGAACATLLPAAALAQDYEDSWGGIAGAKLAFSSERGGLAGVSLTTGSGPDQASLHFAAEVSQSDRAVELGYSDRLTFSGMPRLGFTALHYQRPESDRFDFDIDSSRVEARLTYGEGSPLTFSPYVMWSEDTIRNIPVGSSALIVADAGRSTRVAIGMDVSQSFGASGAGVLSFGTELGEIQSTGRYMRNTATVRGRSDLGSRFKLSGQLSAGHFNAMGATSSIGNRFVLGAESVRGFAFAGWGPRDLNAPSTPTLGGNSYMIAKVDLRAPGLFGFADNFVPGLFVDAGTLFGLNNTAGGPAGANPVDDTSHWRGSVGLSLGVEMGKGELQLSVSSPFAKQSYDETQAVQVSFQTRF